MIRQEVLKKLDTATLTAILSAQIDELTERRNVQDARLFRHCFFDVAPTVEDTEDGQTDLLTCVTDFSNVAGEAFTAYHDLRAKGAYVDDEGNVVADVDTADQAGDADPAPTEEGEE